MVLSAQDSPAPRSVCPCCRRPQALCYCEQLRSAPPVDNRTPVIILQHPRERSHPLGTVGIARLGLRQVQVEVAGGGWGGELEHPLRLPPGVALLYPHPEARRLDRLPPAERPAALLVLDGTWPNARKLYRHNPWAAALPHVRLAPAAPGRYRIRREPQAHCLSTIEAVVQALMVLEPQTAGLPRLLRVFDAMIESQVRQIESQGAGPRFRRRPRLDRSLASALARGWQRLVVVYGESVPAAGGGRALVQWVAVRPASGERLACLIRPAGADPDGGHLAHMQLTLAQLRQGVAFQRFSEQWHAFVGRDALVAAWNRSTLRLVRGSAVPEPDTLELKAAYCNRRRGRCGSLEQVVRQEGLAPESAPGLGRAALRLGQALAVARLLAR